MDRKQAMIMLNRNRRYMPVGVYKTIKGQIVHGDIEAAQKGIKRLQRRFVGGNKNVQMAV